MIELNHSNYVNYLPINIIGFSYAYFGAQGEPGGVKIMDKEGKMFHFNYLDNEFSKNEIHAICPILKEIESEKKHKEWTEMYMGAGNYLYVNKSISHEVGEKAQEFKGISGALFRNWPKIIHGIIKK